MTKPNTMRWAYSGLAGEHNEGQQMRISVDEYYQQTHGPYNPEFIPVRLRNIMRRDPQIQLALWAMKAPIIGANYDVECRDKNIAAFVEAILEEQRYDFFKKALNALEHGFQAFGVEWEQRNFTYKFKEQDKDGLWQLKWRTRRNAYVPALKDLDPAYVGLVYDTKGRYTGLKYDENMLMLSSRIYNSELTYIHTFNEEYGNKAGDALLLNVYNSWYFCNMCYLHAMRYLERKGDPPYVGTAPSQGEVRITGDDQAKSPSRFMGTQLYNLRGGGNIVFPSIRDDKGNLLYTLEELPVADRAEMFIDYINHFQVQKIRGLLIPEQMLVQMSQTGSYAQASEHSKVASFVLDYILNKRINSINKYLMPKLVQYEFGFNAPIPKIIPKGISKDSEAAYRSLVEKVIQAQSSKDFMGERLDEVIDHVKLLEQINIPTDYHKMKRMKVLRDKQGIISVGEEDKNTKKPGENDADKSKKENKENKE